METTINFSHIPVFYKEAIEALDIKPDGIYVDCTGGGGGHSSLIAEKLITGHLYTIDRDPDAIKVLKARFDGNDKVTIINSRFSRIKEILEENGVEKVDGILADLGVSSYQLDTAERGFSFHSDAPLDMRMSKEGLSARDVVNTHSAQEIAKILSTYGEEKFARAIANNIVKYRETKEIETTLELAEIIKQSYPPSVRRKSGHPAKKSFMGLRIFINQEFLELENSLDDMFNSLNVGGRVVIITFHSLEDRIVKVKFNDFCSGCTCPPEFPVCVCGKTPRGKLAFKVKEPTEKEIEENSRSRSAKLRAVEKVED